MVKGPPPQPVEPKRPVTTPGVTLDWHAFVLGMICGILLTAAVAMVFMPTVCR